jgi:hypothetical protein
VNCTRGDSFLRTSFQVGGTAETNLTSIYESYLQIKKKVDFLRTGLMASAPAGLLLLLHTGSLSIKEYIAAKP